MKRCYHPFNGKPQINPDWEDAACACNQLGLAPDQLDWVLNALHAVQKYSRTCQLIKGYTPQGRLCLFMQSLKGVQQKSPALDTLCMWIVDEHKIEWLFAWLHETARISYVEMADSPF